MPNGEEIRVALIELAEGGQHAQRDCQFVGVDADGFDIVFDGGELGLVWCRGHPSILRRTCRWFL